jgi:MoxR-like ATPase
MAFDFSDKYYEYQKTISQTLVGFENIAECVLVALLARGHVLLEGPPGVAKTVLAKTFSSMVDANFKRIQFTPDLLPTDILGTMIYDPSSKKFNTRFGPIFTNILLADEINRASPKTQSALLEAMEERQITIEGQMYKLEEPFMVIATQNPVEQEGTYPLPEAQLDRFLFKVKVNYPTSDNERLILKTKFAAGKEQPQSRIFSRSEIFGAIKSMESVNASEQLMNFASDLICALRKEPSIVWGPSTRASISAVRVGKALAMLDGRDYALPRDILKYAEWILGHRIGISPEYELEGTNTTEIVRKAIDSVDAV